MKRPILKVLGLVLIGLPFWGQAQNREAAQEIISDLCSKKLSGRGYTKKGHVKAAEYIADAFKERGAQPFNQNYFQTFNLSVNTFPGAMEIEVDEVEFIPGKDFIPMVNSHSINGEFGIKYVGRKQLQDVSFLEDLKQMQATQILYLDTLQNASETLKNKRKSVLQLAQIYPVLEGVEKLTFGQGRAQNVYGAQVLAGKITPQSKTVEIDIEAEFKANLTSQNVIAYIPGTINPDSFVVITAHYDHLGNIGKKTFIPGANDNASGVAMMLDMCDYLYKNAPSYSVLFIAFGGEEAGLVGSKFYTENPDNYVSLDNMVFLINVDLMGSGQEGIMAVNGRVFTEAYQKLTAINTTNNYLTEVKARGEAANSDHYFFTKKGVPSFFFYLMGPYQYYHEVDDNAENLVLSGYYDKAFFLIRDFAESFWLTEP